jgi:GrpB-like predicted nucleotidyltransferase (UPF0157 family)
MNRSLEQRIADAIREEVAIAEYNPHWPEAFRAEVHALESTLAPGVVRRIEHFGSTAVPGLAAKPIVDMLIEVNSLADVAERIVPVLEVRSYEYFWRTDVTPAYAWFIKRDAQKVRTHHLHMVEASSVLWERLLFRDYLCEHPEEAGRYAQLKRRLAREHPNDRIAYTSGKANYIECVMRKARAYYVAT